MRAVDGHTGSDKGRWSQPPLAGSQLRARLLLGGWLLWPTQHPDYCLRVIHHSTGQPHFEDMTFNRQLATSNPAIWPSPNGCLVVGGNNELTGYIAPNTCSRNIKKTPNGPKPAPPACTNWPKPKPTWV